MTLPNFLIIGAAKAGTTTLHAYLRPHPEIFMPARKELRYFAYKGSGDDYAFPVKTRAEYEGYFAEAGAAKAVGEASPQYLRSAVAAQRIREEIPGCRIVVSLRNPVEQAFSAYLMGLRNGKVAPGMGFTEALATHPVLGRGYAEDIERYFSLFAREQIHIIRFETLVRDPLPVAQALYGFLGVAPDFAPEVEQVSNPGGLPKNRFLHRLLADKRVMDFGKRYLPERWLDRAKKVRNDNLEKQRMTPGERAAAMAMLEGDILRTGELVGLDLSSWLRMPEASGTGAGPGAGGAAAAAPAKATAAR
jgi:Sulfotransferase domain